MYSHLLAQVKIDVFQKNKKRGGGGGGCFQLLTQLATSTPGSQQNLSSPTHSFLLPCLKLNLWPRRVWTCKGPVDTAAPLVPHDCRLATHDRFECTGTKDNQISLHLGCLPLGLFMSRVEKKKTQAVRLSGQVKCIHIFSVSLHGPLFYSHPRRGVGYSECVMCTKRHSAGHIMTQKQNPRCCFLALSNPYSS